MIIDATARTVRLLMIMNAMVWVAALVTAACVPPQQQPSYFGPQQPQPPQQQQGYPPPQSEQQPPPIAATASCQDTIVCYGQCNPLTEACVSACDQRTTPDSVQNAHALLQCMAQSGCADQNCVAQKCGAQITTCTNITIAAAPAPVASGPDEVMTPEYYVGGTIKVPKPRRLLTQGDLVGDWHQDDSGGKWYYNSSGQYTGFSSLSTSDSWKIDAQGNLVENFAAGYASSNGAHGFKQQSTGKVSIANNIVTLDLPPQNGNKAYREQYIVDGWFVGPDVIMLKVQGPFGGSGVTDKDIRDIDSNSYRDKTYVKKR